MRLSTSWRRSAWATLGTSILARTGEFDSRLGEQVAQLWGGRHRQVAPTVWVERTREVTEREPIGVKRGKQIYKEVKKTVIDDDPVRLTQSRVKADLRLTHRQKGLLWYDTYDVVFSGRFLARNPDAVERTIGVELRFPSAQAIYDGFLFRVNGEAAPPANDLTKGLRTRVTVPPGGEVTIDVGYKSRGLDDWTYAFVGDGVGEVSDFDLIVNTNFREGGLPSRQHVADGEAARERRAGRSNGSSAIWSPGSTSASTCRTESTPDRSPRDSPPLRRSRCSSSSPSW